jgi:CubicO group peptidase (beta-lactamase class C family)
MSLGLKPIAILVFFALLFSPVGADRLTRTQIELLRSEAVSSRSDAFLIWQDGGILIDYSRQKSPELIESMSVTKSVVALAIGKLITDGKLSSVDQPVADFYPEWKQGSKRRMTIRHLLSHTSGLQNVRHTGEEIYPAPDFVQLALSAELDSEPGEKFSYNNKAVNLLAGVVERCSGQPLDEYLRDHLFNELGIDRYGWTRDRSGNPHAMSGLQIAPKDLLKIGRLVLNRGSWEGRQVLSSEWLDEALSAQGSSNCTIPRPTPSLT